MNKTVTEIFTQLMGDARCLDPSELNELMTLVNSTSLAFMRSMHSDQVIEDYLNAEMASNLVMERSKLQ